MSDDFIPCEFCNQSDQKSANYCRNCGKPKHNKLKNKFNCPHCGNRISDYSEFCESCGSKISKELHYSFRDSEILKCPNCNTMNDIDAKKCSNCGKQLPITAELHFIDCPGCGKQIMDDVNYCRYCGYSFVGFKSKSDAGLGSFARKLKSSAYKMIGDPHCSNCNEVHGGQPKYCNRCSSEMIIDINYKDSGLTIDEYRLKLVNKIMVPLSKHYKTNFRKTTLRDYFNLTKEQELYIIYILMEAIKKNDNEDVVKLFESTLKKSKEDYRNLEETILKSVKQELTDMFNSNGISASDVTTVKSSHYDTIETPIVQDKYGGLTKGAATLGFGIIGLAASSGVKTTTETKQVFRSGEYAHYQITFNNRGIVLKSYNNNSPSKSFNSKPGMNQMTIKYEDVYSFNRDNFTFFLESGENFGCPAFDLKYLIRVKIREMTKTYDYTLNNRLIQEYTDNINKKIKLIVGDLINEQITLARDTKKKNQEQSNVDISGLEKIVEMYEKGLLTDEEFTTMKQNIIGNNAVEKDDGSSAKFCGNCGAEIIEDSNFCIQCGNPIK